MIKRFLHFLGVLVRKNIIRLVSIVNGSGISSPFESQVKSDQNPLILKLLNTLRMIYIDHENCVKKTTRTAVQLEFYDRIVNYWMPLVDPDEWKMNNMIMHSANVLCVPDNSPNSKYTSYLPLSANENDIFAVLLTARALLRRRYLCLSPTYPPSAGPHIMLSMLFAVLSWVRLCNKTSIE